VGLAQTSIESLKGKHVSQDDSLHWMQQLPASGYLSAVFEGGDTFAKLRDGIEETKELFLFLSEHIHMLDPDRTTPLTMEDWLSLKQTMVSYITRHPELERSQVLFLLTILRGIDELHHLLKQVTRAQVIEEAELHEPLEHWFGHSEVAQWLSSIMELFFIARERCDTSVVLREHLWALAGRALKEIVVPFYQMGRSLDEMGWWQYVVSHGWITPLCYLRHPQQLSQAEEWRRDILATINEDEYALWL
jgi:hypothetical protein